MKKFIITIIVLAFLVAGGYGWWVMFHRFGALVTNALIEEGSNAFGTTVTVGDVDVKWAEGALVIRDLQVGNPAGFESDYVVSFGAIEAAVDYESMEVARVILDDTRFHIEERDGRTNVEEIRKSLERGTSEEPDFEGSSEDEIVIQRFLMRSSTATFESVSLNRISEVRIDEIEMRNLRGTGEEIAGQIGNRILEEVAEEAAREMLKAQASEQLEQLEGRVSEKLREILGKDDSDSKQD